MSYIGKYSIIESEEETYFVDVGGLSGAKLAYVNQIEDD